MLLAACFRHTNG